MVDVVIIGAGAAGLAAAKTLGELGVPLVLLEASHRNMLWRDPTPASSASSSSTSTRPGPTT